MKPIIVIAACMLITASCKKQEEWLDVKSNRSDVVPTTLKDFQAILDYPAFMNDVNPGLPLISSDNYYVPFSRWQADATVASKAYVWAADEFYRAAVVASDWSNPYATISYANIVLDGLVKIERTDLNKTAWDNCRGAALFYRAYSFYNLAATFAKPYTAATAATDLGIPLRLNSDINQKSTRATLKETYDQIVGDLKEAVTLLPVTAQYQTRPSSIAAHALLARVHLNMEDYGAAGSYADKAITGNNTNRLIDFNTLSTTATDPIPAYPNNTEMIFFATQNAFSFFTNATVDTTLFRSYANNDLRRTVFYSSNFVFRGDYTGAYGRFCGLALNEQYLIRAEAAARAGNTGAAMQDLNTLLTRRWKTSTFVPYTATNAAHALDQVIAERRKELPFTGSLRWEDLRRLNKDSRYATTLTRVLNNQIFTLPPNDPRYVLPIPPGEISLSGIPQNPR